MSLYAFPIVGRAGLGNMLFPWARAEIFGQDHGVRILAPAWNSLRIGPYLRREPEKRRYIGFFSAPDHVWGLTRMLVKARARRFDEAEADLALAAKNDREIALVVFKGLNDLFVPLQGKSALIRERLWAMTRERYRGRASEFGDRFIAMHIRRGDITRQGLDERGLQAMTQYTPTAWFASIARAVRTCRELDSLPIVLFTDGDAAEVAEVLEVRNVHLNRPGTAIADLWGMTRGKLLIASGYSTFSMWASYLGGMPTRYAPGKLSQRVQLLAPTPLEIELPAGGAIPTEVVSRVGEMMASKPAIGMFDKVCA
jgi:hypothetical protein